MAAPTTRIELIELLQKCRLFETGELDPYLARPAAGIDTALGLVERMLADGLLTKFQAGQLLKGKYRGFVLGKYRLLDRIGMGGMGQVFLAEHAAMKRRVAIKVLPPDRAKNEFATKRFLREARATGQLDHPNIVKAFDVDTDGDIHFLVLEYVEGASFQDLVARSGALAPERVAHYLGQALAGLQYLHDRGFIHRDIKPANLIVDRAGVVKLLDLGLVRSETEGDDLTRKENVKFLGTADYLAPEQAVDCKTVDGRADVYSLGATGYFLLTGMPPFAGTSVAAKLIAHQAGEVRPAHEVKPTVPVALSAVIQKMMAKRPGDRFASPAEAIPAFSEWCKGSPPPLQGDELPAGRSTGASIQTGTVNTFPSAHIRSGSARGGVPGQTTGSGIRLCGDSSGAGTGIPSPAIAVKSATPTAHIFNPKPDMRPPVLPACLSHGAETVPLLNQPPVSKKKTNRSSFWKMPLSGAKKKHEPKTVATDNPTRRLGVRRLFALVTGFFLTVALTAWNSVRVMTAHPREPQTVQSNESTARR
jgi:serine/threonine protein kinase